MIILAVVLLSISCILLARWVYKLQKRVNDLHNETNNRVSKYYIETTREHGSDLNKIHTMIMELQLHIENDTQSKLEKLTEDITKKIPITNDKLLKEVQQMRDDFFALRQNF